MSDVASRPSGPRGRGSDRSGRGGFARSGRGGTRQTNGDKTDTIAEQSSVEDEGEIGQLKNLYSSQLSTIKEMFPAWTDEDIVFALQETGGDLESTVDRMASGNTSQWGEVKKKTKERSQSKAKETPIASTEPAPSTRGGRGRGGLDGVRGGRGRGSDRGRGGIRGGRGAANSSRGAPAVKSDTTATEDNSSWDNAGTNATASSGGWDSSDAQADGTPLESSWEHVTAAEASSPPAASTAIPAETSKAGSKPDGTRSWASMFAKPAPAPKAPRAAPSHDAPVEPPIAATSNPVDTGLAGLPPPLVTDTPEIPNTPPGSDFASEPPANITPSKDELTETNVEQVLDTSGPTASATAASTVASTIGGATPTQASHQLPGGRPPLGGFATSAYKATGMPGRSASYQRKIVEQQQAVVMPGKHAVDRAAVQFGSMGLNGTTEDVDVDSDREDAETRTQPPQHSPIAPRASLPPVPQQQVLPPQLPTDTLPTPRQAPGLPPVNSGAQQLPVGEQGAGQQAMQTSFPYHQFGERYNPQSAQQEPSASNQKAYEAFGHQGQHSQYDGFPAVSQAQTQPHHPGQSHQGGISSASNDVSSHYTTDNQRNAYPNQYYGSYSHQPQHSSQDPGASQQRVGSAFGTSSGPSSSQFATAQPPQPPGRYGQSGEAQTSGHSTPNPVPGQGHPHQVPQQQGQGQGSAQQGAYPGYAYPYGGYYSSYGMNQQVSNHPYGRERPMFDDARRYDDQYLTHNNQYGYGGGQGGYGGGPFGGAGGKGGMYGQPHQGYGMSPQTSYDQHSASPANAGAFGQQIGGSGRDGATTSGLGSYGRSGSTQPSDSQPFPGSTSQGGRPDTFGHAQSSYQGQNQGLGAGIGQQGADDSLRAYGDSSKVPGGPSPALGQLGTRPGSTANPQNQSGLPTSQSERYGQGYGGYPAHMGHAMHGQQGSQYGAGPATSGHQTGNQSQQAGGYGQYGANNYGSSYYGNSNRGGWAANYGH